jgi:thiol-disulfide isomerase/thioredoxin
LRRYTEALLVGLLLAATPPAGAQVPRESLEFAFKVPSGNELLLSTYKGKNAVVLMFVSTDCSHCRDTCAYMEGIQKKYGPRGLRTLAVAFNDMAVLLVPDFIRRAQATFPVGYATRGSVFTYLGLRPNTKGPYVPILVFIDRKGIIRGQYLGDDPFQENRDKNISAKIEELLKESAAKVATGRR